MKTLVVLYGLVAVAFGATHPSETDNVNTITVEDDFVERQYKVLSLVTLTDQKSHDWEHNNASNYYIERNIDKYTDKGAVEEFLFYSRTGFMPKYRAFSPFYKRMRDEAIAIFKIMYYAADFDTFFSTAAYIKKHLNDQQFLYAYYIAVLQRNDTQGIVLPAPFEAYPGFFINMMTLSKLYRIKMNNGSITENDSQFGIVKEGEKYIFYANYSNSLVYPNQESRLAYFTEDIGLNAYYYYYHSNSPFWWNANKRRAFKERGPKIYNLNFYRQLLARYYLERLPNGLGKIPEFSWYTKFDTGYYPDLSSYSYPFAQRSNDFVIYSKQNYAAIRYLDSYEKSFFSCVKQCHFMSDADSHNERAMKRVGDDWQTNAELYSDGLSKDCQLHYGITARHVLSGAPKPLDKYTFMPSSLDFYKTTLRDPAFYQLHQRIVNYFTYFRKNLKPYTDEDLQFVGVKIIDVEVDQLVTYFDYYDFNAQSEVYASAGPEDYIVRQSRLNHKPFSLDIVVKSDDASDAVFKILLGPKYYNDGYPITLEEEGMEFYELDRFNYRLEPGENKINRSSNEFIHFKDDSVRLDVIYKLLKENKVPKDMSTIPGNLPRRLMLPKGTDCGFPFQLFVFVYPNNGVNRAFGFPFDRPLREVYFDQPNMFFKKVQIYHEGKQYPWEYNVPSYFWNKRNHT